MLDSDMREAREGEIIIQDMDSTTVRSMIHYIYTGEMSEDWQDLDILEVARAADMYDMPGWVKVCWTKLESVGSFLTEKQREKIAERFKSFVILANLNHLNAKRKKNFPKVECFII